MYRRITYIPPRLTTAEAYAERLALGFPNVSELLDGQNSGGHCVFVNPMELGLLTVPLSVSDRVLCLSSGIVTHVADADFALHTIVPSLGREVES